MPDRQGRDFVAFGQGIRWAFDAPLHTVCAQHMSYDCCFSGAKLTMQADKALTQAGLTGQPYRKTRHGPFVRPRLGFYNGGMGHFNEIDAGQTWVDRIRQWARELGFSQIGVADIDLAGAEPGLQAWLTQGFHGEMNYMAAHGLKRARPAELVEGTLSVITARMDYLPQSSTVDWQGEQWQRISEPDQAYVSLYARGRDYHRTLRARLQKLAQRMTQEMGPMGFRVFTDSAPVLEVELGSRSGLGWRGKHTLLLDRSAGSMFFLGEIFIDRALPRSDAQEPHCGTCQACVDVCPTQAIVAPYRLDARRCLSYLSIEHAGAIPPDLRRAMGNRIYGCDDCQLVCPWNKYAQRSALSDFAARSVWVAPDLCDLFSWTEDQFLQYTEGSAIRRIGYQRWQRNLAVALGNALRDGRPKVGTDTDEPAQHLARRARQTAVLRAGLGRHGALVDEHIAWALSWDNPEQDCGRRHH